MSTAAPTTPSPRNSTTTTHNTHMKRGSIVIREWRTCATRRAVRWTRASWMWRWISRIVLQCSWMSSGGGENGTKWWEVQKAVGSGQKAESGKLTKAEFLLESRQGRNAVVAGARRRRPSRIPQLARARWMRARSMTRVMTVVVVQRLGRCLRAQGKPSAAAEQYRAAVCGGRKVGTDRRCEASSGGVHTDLANVLTDLGRYDEARKED